VSITGHCPECGQDLDLGGNEDCPVCAAEPVPGHEEERREELLAICDDCHRTDGTHDLTVEH
jgi:hypothetical protein